MRVFPIDPPKRINPDGLSETLGHPLSVETRPDGLATHVRVQERYDRLDGTAIVPATTNGEVLAAITAHDPKIESAAERDGRVERERLADMHDILTHWPTATPLEKDRATRWMLGRLTR